VDKSPAALVVATMDTKGREALFLSECLSDQGITVRILDGGIRGDSPVPVAIRREAVAAAAGLSMEAIRAIGHEGDALQAMCRGAAALAQKLFQEGEIQGIIGLGGSMGTTLGTAVMRQFPVGVPKVMISTMASRDTRAFVGTKDILMLHAVCDLIGLNRVSRKILRNGALALAGMLRNGIAMEEAETSPLIFLSTLGTTEACAQQVRSALEADGYEVVIFHTVGSGGRAMEEILSHEKVAAMIDLSLHEVADHLFGGDYDAGPERGLAAVRKGIPTLLVPGNIDFLVTGPLEAARRRFPDRPYHVHNAAITVFRTAREEMLLIADRLAEICRQAGGPLEVLVPLGGFSAFDSEAGPLHDPIAPQLFVNRLIERTAQNAAIQQSLRHINAPEFAGFIVERLKCMTGKQRRPD
jgi:uncharacterized protein (UPF0261 family)